MDDDGFIPMPADEFARRVAAWQADSDPNTPALHRYLGYPDRHYDRFVAMVQGYGWSPVPADSPSAEQ